MRKLLLFVTRLINAWNDRFASRDWQRHQVRENVVLCTGEICDDAFVWRRRTKGAWQFRRMTPDELDSALMDFAIK